MDSSDSEEEWMDEDNEVKSEDGEDIVLSEIGKEAEEISFTRSGRSISHKEKWRATWIRE